MKFGKGRSHVIQVIRLEASLVDWRLPQHLKRHVFHKAAPSHSAHSANRPGSQVALNILAVRCRQTFAIRGPNQVDRVKRFRGNELVALMKR